VHHHLAIAGRKGALIAADEAARLHRYASGVPRALNNVATAALMAAAAESKGIVDDVCAKKAVAELARS
jgi:type II secretory pathway predicted ATPase ExeA